MKRFTFPKKKRLVRAVEFKVVLARNLCVSNGLLRLYMAENDCGYPRLGLSIGKEWGSAVVRNRLKRILREVFRQSQDEIPPDFDYLLMLSRRQSITSDKAIKGREAVARLEFERARASFLALVNAAMKRADEQ